MLVQLLGLSLGVINSGGCIHRGAAFLEGRAHQDFECILSSFSLTP